MNNGHADTVATPHLTISDSEWEQARIQARVIARLAEHEKIGVVAADAAAEELGAPRRQIYWLLQRQGSGLVIDLFSRQPHGGRGWKVHLRNRASVYRTLKGVEAMHSLRKIQGAMFACGHPNPDAVIVSRVFEAA